MQLRAKEALDEAAQLLCPPGRAARSGRHGTHGRGSRGRLQRGGGSVKSFAADVVLVRSVLELPWC